MSNFSEDKSRQKEEVYWQEGGKPDCPICDDRKYLLVATRKLGSGSIMYEKRECHECLGEPVHHSEGDGETTRHPARKRQSGTGYLRNKKRRRKEEM